MAREGRTFFRDRTEAANLLAIRLNGYRNAHPLVLGVPRGGVPMAKIVADRLGGDLDVVLVHKLRAPDQPELAVGSIDESGRVYLAPFARDLRLDESVLAEEQRTQLALLKARRARYTAVRPPIDPAGRTVILVDDGLATGSTMIAAVRSMKAQRAGRIVVAVAVAPPDTIKTIGLEADEVVCLYAPVWFGAVGAFFEDFSEVTDDVVVDLLRTSVTTPVRPGREKAG